MQKEKYIIEFIEFIVLCVFMMLIYGKEIFNIENFLQFSIVIGIGLIVVSCVGIIIALVLIVFVPSVFIGVFLFLLGFIAIFFIEHRIAVSSIILCAILFALSAISRKQISHESKEAG